MIPRNEISNAAVSAADVVLDQPASRPVEGSPIGNGRMGTLAWTTPDALQFQINRVDVFAVNRNTAGSHFPGVTDYGGGCGRVTISIGGEPFRAGPGFHQQLSLYDARCTVTGEGMTASCWVSAMEDVLIITLTDTRVQPQPIEVRLAMWRDPEVRHGAHVAAYAFHETPGVIAIVQTFREADHYCSSAVAVGVPKAMVEAMPGENRARVLRLPAQSGTRSILITSAASWEEKVDAGDVAARVIEAVSQRSPAELVAEHERWWHDFWNRTVIDVKSPGGRAEKAVRLRTLFLYHMAATSRGEFPPKWNGSIFLTDGDARDWGSQFWLWTTEMLYWPLHAADAGNLCAPFFDMYHRQLPAAETAAHQRWNAGGAFFPETAPFDGPLELPAELVPEYRDVFLHGKPNSGISTKLAAHCRFEWHLAALLYTRTDTGCDSYSWISHLASSGAELAVHAWWRYRYTGEMAWLRSHAYPLLRGVAEFYRSYCGQGEDGCYHIHGTNAHEDFWGVTDSIMDLAAIRGTVPLAIRAADILGVDAELRQQWRAFLDQLAPYPMGDDPRAKDLTGAALAEDAWAAGFKNAVDGSHNSEDVQLTPIFPFEDWTMETRDPRLDAVAHRTLEVAPRHRAVLGGAALNTAIRSPIAVVRTGRSKDLPAILDRYCAAFAPQQNGFSLFEQITAGTQAHSIEHLGLLTMILQESLLQSVAPRPGEQEIISVFPAWPKDWDVQFRLLARGGFLVTSSRIAGNVDFAEIQSRRGEQCRFRNYWNTACTVEETGGSSQKMSGEILTFSTQSGKTYRIIPVTPIACSVGEKTGVSIKS